MPPKNKHNSGFTLIEISIVIIISGLLISGIVAAKSIIHTAKMRTIINDFKTFETATRNFETQYNALPGDAPDGFEYWGTDCGTDNNVMITDGGCNGDNDNTIEPGLFGGEQALAWEHLTLAGIINGNYDGEYERDDFVGGVDVPQSDIRDGLYSIIHISHISGNAAIFSGSRRLKHLIHFGTYRPSEWNYAPVLTPHEARRLDLKIDDGNPGTGLLATTPDYDGGSFDATTCLTDHTITAKYLLSDTTVSCAIDYSFEGSFGPTL